MITKVYLLIYGLLLLGGAYGGWKAGSKVSLMMGLVSGVAILLSLAISMQNSSLGYGLCTGISGLLTIVFIIRLLKTHQLMPSGMLLAISVLALIVSAKALLEK
jgi:uncharacterized membrane protein (UPF0136 family)